jgi:Sigma-70 region 2
MPAPRLVENVPHTLPGRSDDELMTLAQAGVREAFGVLVERHAQRLVHACARFVNDAEVGSDLAQETWVAAWAARSRYRADGKFFVWLLAAAQPVQKPPQARGRRAHRRREGAPRARDRHPRPHAGRDGPPRPTGAEQAPPRARWLWPSAGAGAVCALAAVLVVHARSGEDGWQARGGWSAAGAARDVLVQPCVAGGALAPLPQGSVIARDAPLTATFRNFGAAPAYLLLFAVDARHVVHWIAPRYTRAEENPMARVLPPSLRQDVLDTSVVFDDLSPGTLRLVAVVSPAPVHVAGVETLDVRELDEDRLGSHFPQGTDVRQTIVEVRGGPNRGAP